jgi:S-adenosylmethionine uptake transporter
MSGNLQGALLALAAFGIYATHDVAVKTLGRAEYLPFQIIFFSTLFSLPLVVVMLMRDRRAGTLIPRHPWWTALRVAAALITGSAAFYAFSTLPLAQVYAILFSTPLLITLLAIPILGERVRLRRGIAVLVGLMGVLIVLRPGAAPLSLGHVAALTAALGSSIAAIALRRVGAEERSEVMLLYPMIANIAAMGAVQPLVYKPMPIEDLGLIAFIAVFGFVGNLMVIVAYRKAEAGIVAPMQYSQILWATAYGYYFFDETPDLGTAIGAAVVIASGLYILSREGRARASVTQPVTASQARAGIGAVPKPAPAVPPESPSPRHPKD